MKKMDTHEVKQARQRASIKWLMSKAFNNRIPENLKEPFYRDHENQEHIKPQIIVGLGNATLYCQTLSNLYSDPNYQSLSHWSILQTLARKGVPVTESPDMPITETVLIQTNPLRINAHMSVIEALMLLYVKEISSGEKITNAITRLAGRNIQNTNTYNNALLFWVSHVCAAFKWRIEREIENGVTDENGIRLQSPDIPPVKDIQDLCDGVCLALITSFYCPKIIPWTKIRINYLPAVEDSVHNILLVYNFSEKYLPYSIFHMTPEDVTYMRGSMKTNLMVLLADLFNVFEIHPVKCVSFPEMNSQQEMKFSVTNEHGITYRRGLTSQAVNPIPDLRSDVDTPSSSTSNKPPFQVANTSSIIAGRRNTPPKEYRKSEEIIQQDEGFVVHKSKGVTTLSSLQEPLVPARLRQSKEKNNTDTKADERGDSLPAGRPSNWEDTRKPSYAGRRSRRNSSGEESQLTIENFGGSQEQLNMIGRNMEKDRERKLYNVAVEPAVAVRSSLSDARGTLQIGYDTDSGSEKQDKETEKYGNNRQNSIENFKTSQFVSTNVNNINDEIVSNHKNYQKESTSDEEIPIQNQSLANTSKTTTWQQQSILLNQSDTNDYYANDVNRPNIDASKLSTVKMKLEEKRRRIEQEKIKMEVAMSRQQEKVGKAAFLQAINKQLEYLKRENIEGKTQTKNDIIKLEPNSTNGIDCAAHPQDDNENDTKKPATNISSKILAENEQDDLDKYQKSIQVMNSNLQDIQQDIQRLTTQQTQIQAQHLQAQQLMQAQQIANMLNQQYSSQHNLPNQYRTISANFGSTPHLSQTYSSPNMFNSRPPSRDLVQNSMQQPIQGINEYGHYVNELSPSINHQQQQIFYNYGNQHIEENNCRGLNIHYPEDHTIMKEFNTSNRENTDFHSHQYTSNQFYLHESPQQPQRKTWAQSVVKNSEPIQNALELDVKAWQSQNSISKINDRTWKSSELNAGTNSFMLHQNGTTEFCKPEKYYKTLFSSSSSPQHRISLKPNVYTTPNNNKENCIPISDLGNDEMAPQSVSFIGDGDDTVDQIEMSIDTTPVYSDINIGKLNISSGSRTYRIPSPSRPLLNSKSFEDPHDAVCEKGFYISFDNTKPKRPKPPLRVKKSPKKERSPEQTGKIELRNNLGEENEIHKTLVKKVHIDNCRLEDVLNSQRNLQENQSLTNYNHKREVRNDVTERHKDITNFENKILAKKETKALVIGTELSNLDPNSVDEMERKKEKIMLLSLQRRQEQEETKARKELEAMQRREKEREKEEQRARKKEEQVARRAAILEAHRHKKAIEEAERDGKSLEKTDLFRQYQSHHAPKLRQQKTVRPRPKTIHVESGSVDLSEVSNFSSRSKKGSNSNLAGYGHLSSNSIKRDYYRGSQDSLAIRESPEEHISSSSTPIGRRGSYKNSREPTIERGRTLSRISIAKGSTLNFRGRKSNSLMNLCDTDSGLGRATPPRRAPSPGMGRSNRHLPSPSGPGSLPPGLISKRRVFDDGASDISSTASSMMEYSGPKLYKQPAAKSNRGIILNAVEYCVFPGAVNRDAKNKVLDKIARSEAKHFLVLFRDAGCQFRALYSYWPENETIVKLFGTGPSQVDEVMFDKFFKYNSGGKCFSQVHTKHLTVTIDAFTIHNSLWQGKKVNLPSKRDMALVI